MIMMLISIQLGYRGSKLNDIGRSQEHEKNDRKNGNILQWKRASERYLMQRRLFTIIHAALLTDDKGGEREIIWDTDDALLRTPFRTIPREDVAEVIVQSLLWKEAISRSIDIASGPQPGPTRDWLRFWSRPGDCLYPDDVEDDNFK
jgi:hypothetical protein